LRPSFISSFLPSLLASFHYVTPFPRYNSMLLYFLVCLVYLTHDT
ncbi:unnamed protein product, partial [Ectocarpus sp. 12 AP-2014]